MAALWASEVRSKRELRHGRRLDDLRAVRDVLDEAAVALNRADYARREMVQGYGQWGRKVHEHKAEAWDELKLAGQKLDVLAQRLKVRLGREHAVVTEFVDASETILAIFRQLVWLDDDEQQQGAERRAALEASGESFEQHWAAFLELAAGAAGARLPEPGTGATG